MNPGYRQRRSEIVWMFALCSLVPAEQIAVLAQGARFSIEKIELVGDDPLAQ